MAADVPAIQRGAAVRRAPCLVLYWERDRQRIYNYATQRMHPGSPLAVSILDLATRWTSRESLVEALTAWSAETVSETIDHLVASDVLSASDRPPSAAERALARWSRWNPAAGFFHRASYGRPARNPDAVPAGRARLLVDGDYPSPLKTYQDGEQIELSTGFTQGDLAELLARRRTWREFGDRGVTLDELSVLLGLTFGVQRWMHIEDGDQRVALKTSPSAGARHSIEAYVLALRVPGLAVGAYHYCPDRHLLTALEADVEPSFVRQAIPDQPGFHEAPLVVVMTSVFERVQWKYDFPRAYRAVLLDAGHLGQTFALVATSLGLAPFGTAATDDAFIERQLEIDGIAESVIFTVGAGAVPSGKSWAPDHDRMIVPRTEAPGWTRRAAAPSRSRHA